MVVKYLGGVFSPFQIIFFSVLFGFPVVAIMLMRDVTDENLRPHHPWWVALRTLAAVCTTASAFFAIKTIPLAQVYAIIFAAPLLITMLAVPILGENVGWRRSTAVMVGLLGVIIVLQPGATEFELGHLAALTAAIGTAVGAVIMRKIGKDERSAVLLLYPMMANFLLMGAMMPFVYEPMQKLELGAVALIAVMSFAGGIALISAYRVGRAVVVAPMQYSQIIWATIYGWLFFGEVIERNTAIGAAIVIASGVYVVLREDQPNVSKTKPVQRSRTRFSNGTAPRAAVMARMVDKKDDVEP